MAKERVLVVGGNAGGMTAASQLRRLTDDATITVFEKGPYVSYGSCGIPFYIGGIIAEKEGLLARSADSFREKGIDVRTRHEVLSIDPLAQKAIVTNLATGDRFEESWDKLLIATGAIRPQPPIPGSDAKGVFMIDSPDSGEAVKRWIEEKKPRRAVVVGGGYIGLEMVDAFADLLGLDVTVIELAPQLMATLDEGMAEVVRNHLESRGVNVWLNESVAEFTTQDGVVTGVKTANGAVDADVVILALGIAPNGKLAAEAGIETGIKGAIVTDDTMRTSAPNVWAAGDCVASKNLLTGKPMHLALGAVANKQGRAAAYNMAGLRETFPGVLGTAVCKICGLEIARTGLLERELRAEGRAYAAETIDGYTAAAYMPNAARMRVKMIAELPSQRVVGVQIVGGEGAAKRIDAAAAAMTAGFSVEQTIYLDFSYAPPLSPLWDPLLQVARNLHGKINGTTG